MYTYIPILNNDYPKRISFNNLFYTEYKDLRPFFFSEKIIKNKDSHGIDNLVPNINVFKDKYSYITNDFVLNSIFFEYCDYFIEYKIDEDINFAMLPVNPYGPTGIGGLGNLKKWGSNHLSCPIIIYYDTKREMLQILVYKNNDTFSLISEISDINESINMNISNILKENTSKIFDFNNSYFIYSGYMNDKNNTDHAWYEINSYLFYINIYQYDMLRENLNENLVFIDLNTDNIEKLNILEKEFIINSLNILNF